MLSGVWIDQSWGKREEQSTRKPGIVFPAFSLHIPNYRE
jgi:hypothetical protein